LHPSSKSFIEIEITSLKLYNIEIKSEFQTGPGLWKFKNSLLEDEDYKELVAFYYPQILQKYSDVVVNNFFGN